MTNLQLLSAKHVGKMLGLCQRTIFRLQSCGEIPAAVKIKGSVRWRQSDIEKWVELGCCDRKTFEATKQAEGK